MPERILVTGGSGQLGKVVVERLVVSGERVRALSRRRRVGAGAGAEWVVGDLRTGRGINTALAGCDVVVHCATDFRRETEVVRALVEAARWSGNPPHVVYVSIVGVDRVPLGYYRAKLESEQLIANSGLPYTIQRATQFHSLVRTAFAVLGRLPVVPVPRWRFQPVDVRDLAVRLAEQAVAEPAGRAPDFGGPQVLTAQELAKAVLAAAGKTRRLLPVSVPGSVYRAYARGGNLTPEHADGVITFERYLAEQAEPGTVRYR